MSFTSEEFLGGDTIKLHDGEQRKLYYLFNRAADQIRFKITGWLRFQFEVEREDVLQETFWRFASLAAQNKLRCLGGQRIGEIADPDLDCYVRSCRCFLLKVAHNYCRHIRRKTTRRRDDPGEILSELFSREPCAEAQIQKSEDHETLHRALCVLPGYIRGAVALCYFGNCSCREAAMALDISRQAVKRRLHYGRRLLRESLMEKTS